MFKLYCSSPFILPKVFGCFTFDPFSKKRSAMSWTDNLEIWRHKTNKVKHPAPTPEEVKSCGIIIVAFTLFLSSVFAVLGVREN